MHICFLMYPLHLIYLHVRISIVTIISEKCIYIRTLSCFFLIYI